MTPAAAFFLVVVSLLLGAALGFAVMAAGFVASGI
jgi:hypothetical protein